MRLNLYIVAYSLRNAPKVQFRCNLSQIRSDRNKRCELWNTFSVMRSFVALTVFFRHILSTSTHSYDIKYVHNDTGGALLLLLIIPHYNESGKFGWVALISRRMFVVFQTISFVHYSDHVRCVINSSFLLEIFMIYDVNTLHLITCTSGSLIQMSNLIYNRNKKLKAFSEIKNEFLQKILTTFIFEYMKVYQQSSWRIETHIGLCCFILNDIWCNFFPVLVRYAMPEGFTF